MTTDPEALLRELEAERVRTLLERAWSRFEAIAHPDLVYVHSTGRRDDRGSLLGVLQDGTLEYHAIDLHPETVVGGEDRLWATGAMTADLTGGGHRIRIESWTSVLWVREADAWRFRAFQGTPVPASSQ